MADGVLRSSVKTHSFGFPRMASTTPSIDRPCTLRNVASSHGSRAFANAHWSALTFGTISRSSAGTWRSSARVIPK